MIHRIPVTENQISIIQDGPQPVKMKLDDNQYELGDYIYFIVFNEHAQQAVSLVARKVIALTHDGTDPEDPVVIVTVQ